mmetsp:Transcript_43628/g.102572  ORF Transcript_43628/g.102572 Transcript_43628/m.102572 type:complete len:87 (+) Transcript_43628:856-1116(+)
MLRPTSERRRAKDFDFDGAKDWENLSRNCSCSAATRSEVVAEENELEDPLQETAGDRCFRAETRGATLAAIECDEAGLCCPLLESQ